MDKNTAFVLHHKTLDQIHVTHKRVLVRVDYNVPIKDGVIQDKNRITQSLPTLTELLAMGAKHIILVSHLGRPDKYDVNYSLEPIREELAKQLHEDIQLAKKPEDIDSGYRVTLLENIRFFEGEEENSAKLAKRLAKTADIYVNDAFGTAHRAHASNNAITRLLPSYIGRLVQKELSMISRVTSPTRPLVTIIGFAKIADKMELLKKLMELSDYVLVGGAVSFTFLAAQGHAVGKSLCETKQIPLAKKLLKSYGSKIILPTDFICATDLQSTVRHVASATQIKPELAGFDIGPATVKVFDKHIKNAKTIFWNGPVGVFEHPPYDEATRHLAKTISNTRAVSIIGGGDTVSAVQKSGYAVSHLSTGGGASLAAIEDTLPAVTAVAKAVIQKTK